MDEFLIKLIGVYAMGVSNFYWPKGSIIAQFAIVLIKNRVLSSGLYAVFALKPKELLHLKYLVKI